MQEEIKQVQEPLLLVQMEVIQYFVQLPQQEGVAEEVLLVVRGLPLQEDQEDLVAVVEQDHLYL